MATSPTAVGFPPAYRSGGPEQARGRGAVALRATAPRITRACDQSLPAPAPAVTIAGMFAGLSN